MSSEEQILRVKDIRYAFRCGRASYRSDIFKRRATAYPNRPINWPYFENLYDKNPFHRARASDDPDS
jgi:hypothetical protein